MDIAHAYELARALAVVVDWPTASPAPAPAPATIDPGFHQAYEDLVAARAADDDAAPPQLCKEAKDAIGIARAYKRLTADVEARREAVRCRLEHGERLNAAVRGAVDAHVALLAQLEGDAGLATMDAAGRAYVDAAEDVAKSRADEIARDVAEWKAGLREAEERLAAMREMLVAGAREVLAGAAEARTCPICFEGEVAVACVPCGHTLCAECHAKTPAASTCHTCRSRVRERIRIYFSV